MITPADNIPLDDSQNSEAADQQSQKDIHSNGLDETQANTSDEQADTALLAQAYKAAESSYTLDLEEKEAEDEKED